MHHITTGSASEKVENLHIEVAAAPPAAHYAPDHSNEISSGDESIDADYKISWRTVAALLALSVAWASVSFAISGPNFAIQYMIADYPQEASKATWIANAPLFFAITLPPFTGAGSDRYGKKWFTLGGALLAIIGAITSATAHNVNTIIGGQAMSGCGGTAAAVVVAAGLEIVPAKTRPVVIALMATFNAALGTIGGQLIFAACVQYDVGWRWGFKILACLYALAFVLVLFFYHPPPTRLRRELSANNLLKSTDFIGIALLAIGSALLIVALVLGGVIYPWNSRYVIPLLVVAPLFFIAFGLYEWKGRSDGIMHHEFFSSISFPVFIMFGFVDGMLLYGTSVFIPNETRAIYTNIPLHVATPYVIFSSCLLPGFIFFGFVSSKTKQFRWPLVASSLLLTVFCGLTVRSGPSSEAYFQGMLGVLGFLTSATEIIPVVGISLIVPSYLIATSNTILGTFRGLGGILSIAVFSAVYKNKATVYIPQEVVPILAKAGVPTSVFSSIIDIVTNTPSLLTQLPNMTAELAAAVIQSSQVGAAHAYQYVWYCLMAVSAACLILSFLIIDAPETMTDLVESALEPSKIREKQQAVA